MTDTPWTDNQNWCGTPDMVQQLQLDAILEPVGVVNQCMPHDALQERMDMLSLHFYGKPCCRPKPHKAAF